MKLGYIYEARLAKVLNGASLLRPRCFDLLPQNAKLIFTLTTALNALP